MHFDHEHIAAPDRQAGRCKACHGPRHTMPLERHRKPATAFLCRPLCPYIPTAKSRSEGRKMALKLIATVKPQNDARGPLVCDYGRI